MFLAKLLTKTRLKTTSSATQKRPTGKPMLKSKEPIRMMLMVPEERMFSAIKRTRMSSFELYTYHLYMH